MELHKAKGKWACRSIFREDFNITKSSGSIAGLCVVFYFPCYFK